MCSPALELTDGDVNIVMAQGCGMLHAGCVQLVPLLASTCRVSLPGMDLTGIDLRCSVCVGKCRVVLVIRAMCTWTPLSTSSAEPQSDTQWRDGLPDTCPGMAGRTSSTRQVADLPCIKPFKTLTESLQILNQRFQESPKQTARTNLSLHDYLA